MDLPHASHRNVILSCKKLNIRGKFCCRASDYNEIDAIVIGACSLVGFWADKSGWCWFLVRGKHCQLADKPWLKPTSEQAEEEKLA